MAWTSTDWISESTDALRLTALRLHIAEVSAAIENRADAVGKDGASLTRPQILQYLDTLLRERDRLEGKASRATAGGRTHVRFIRPG